MEPVYVDTFECPLCQIPQQFRIFGLSEPVEIGIRGQRLRHGTPSFSAPGDRNSRARKKEMSAKCCRGGLNPLRGPLVACRPASRLLSVQAQSQACRHSLGLLAINPEFSERI